MPLPLGAILLDIDINWKFATIDPKSKGMILNLFIKTGNHMETILWSINATTTGRNLVIDINCKLITIDPKFKRDDPQPVY